MGFPLPKPSGEADWVAIPRTQRDFHVATEWAALLLVVPALTWVALNPKVPPAARTIAGLVALGNLIVDGDLLMRWYRR